MTDNEVKTYFNNMSGEEKESAEQIAKLNFRCDFDNRTEEEALLDACIEMAKWKDEQFENALGFIKNYLWTDSTLDSDDIAKLLKEARKIYQKK